MTLQNRVTPLGELVADPARGLVFGNRGCLHNEHGRIRRAFASLTSTQAAAPGVFSGLRT